MKEALWSAVDGLPDNYLNVLHYRYRAKITLKEIGENLGYYEQYIEPTAIRHVGVAEFKRTWLGSTELEALKELGYI